MNRHTSVSTTYYSLGLRPRRRLATLAGVGLTSAAALIGLTVQAQQGPMRTQAIPLQVGWNAVLLQVEPENTDPNAVFAGTPVDVAARYFTPVTSIQFISDPADEPWNEPGWGVWYAPERPDAFLSSLHAIQANRCYLLHSTEDVAWELTGRARPASVSWKVAAYNLVGFTLDSEAPPTFSEFFSGTEGRIGQRILRLRNDKWKLVQDPGIERMRDGEAYWIHCGGRTDYPGPLELSWSGPEGIDFGAGGAKRVILRNRTREPVTVSLERLAGGGEPMIIREVIRELSRLTTTYPLLPSRLEFELGPNASRALDLQVRGETLSGDSTALLKFTTDGGAVVWLPVTAKLPSWSGR